MSSLAEFLNQHADVAAVFWSFFELREALTLKRLCRAMRNSALANGLQLRFVVALDCAFRDEAFGVARVRNAGSLPLSARVVFDRRDPDTGAFVETCIPKHGSKICKFASRVDYSLWRVHETASGRKWYSPVGDEVDERDEHERARARRPTRCRVELHNEELEQDGIEPLRGRVLIGMRTPLIREGVLPPLSYWNSNWEIAEHLTVAKRMEQHVSPLVQMNGNHELVVSMLSSKLVEKRHATPKMVVKVKAELRADTATLLQTLHGVSPEFVVVARALDQKNEQKLAKRRRDVQREKKQKRKAANATDATTDASR